MMPQALTRAALQRTGCAGVLLLLGWPAFAQVGIGTNEPTARLHIVGRAVENGQDLRVENLDPAPVPADARVVVSDSEGYFYTATIEQLVDIDDEEDDELWFLSSDSTPTFPRIYTDSNVGIGVTTPAYTLDVEGDFRVTGSVFAGERVITNATFATSDRRYKRDISPYTDGLEIVRALEPVKFRYTEAAPLSTTDALFYGLIAQDAREVDSNFVDEVHLSRSQVQSAAEAESFLVVDSQRLIFSLLSAVKALDEKDREIDALSDRLSQLEAKFIERTTPPPNDQRSLSLPQSEADPSHTAPNSTSQ